MFQNKGNHITPLQFENIHNRHPQSSIIKAAEFYSIYLQGMRRLDLTSSLGEVKKGIDTTEYEWIRELAIFSKKE